MKKGPGNIDSAAPEVKIDRRTAISALISSALLAACDTNILDPLFSDESASTYPAAPKDFLEDPNKRIEEERIKSAKLDKMILQIESAMITWSAEVQKIVDEKVQDAHLKKEIMAPFEVIRLNGQNPYKNSFNKTPAIIADQDKELLPEGFLFQYGLFSEGAQLFPQHVETTAFSDISFLTVYFKEDEIDPFNIIDMLTVFHELRHIVQELKARQQVNDMAEHGEEIRSLKARLRDEATACAYCIELLNLMLDGTLEDAVKYRKEGKLIDLKSKSDRAMELLEQISTSGDYDPQRQNIWDFYCTIAQFYYPQGVSTGQFSKEYIEAMIDYLSETQDPEFINLKDQL